MADLIQNLMLLDTAASTCQGRVDSGVLTQIQGVVDRAGRRLSLAANATVIAIAGATGSGKSSLFNAISRTALAAPGVRRPMTEKAMAVTFGDTDTTELLDWLQIDLRHVTAGGDLKGVVLLDLADFDSVVVDHREEVDRLVEVADRFLWVVDPQKYADAVLHERYLKRMVAYGDVMTFVLNQTDRLTADQTSVIHRDLVDLLKDHGLANPTVFNVSALTGDGIVSLRRHLAKIAAGKRNMVNRLATDILSQARSLKRQLGPERLGELPARHLDEVTGVCLEVAGAPGIEAAVRESVRRAGTVATGWPVVSWIPRLRPDALKRLHPAELLTRRAADKPGGARVDPADEPHATFDPVSQARVDTAVRSVVDASCQRLPRSWHRAVTHVVRQQAATLPEGVVAALSATDLGVKDNPAWWSVVRVLQWLVLAAAVVGVVWLLLAVAIPSLGFAWPALLAVGGVVAGVALGLASRLGVNVAAGTAASRAGKRLRAGVEAVVAAKIIGPINEELHRHDKAGEILNEVIASLAST